MWLSPRSTVRWLIVYRPAYLAHLLIAVMIFSDLMRSTTGGGWGDRLSLGTILIIAGSVALPYMTLYLYVFSWIVKCIGRLFGGSATVTGVRTALAWASVPLFASALLIIPQLSISGINMFRRDVPMSTLAAGVSIAFGALHVVLLAWWFVILVVALSEAQQFARWKALISYLLSIVAVILPIVGIILWFARRS